MTNLPPQITKKEAREYALGLTIDLLEQKLDQHPFGEIKRVAVEKLIKDLQKMIDKNNR